MKRGPKPIDMTGEVYDRLTVISYQGSGRWVCECECGTTKPVSGVDLRRGRIRSCGCLWREKLEAGTRPTVHGLAGTPEYNTWQSMHRRCQDSERLEYQYYGARGIKVCDRWSSIEAFIEDMGPRPAGYTLDRIDPTGNYEPSNCRWADNDTQQNNKRASRRLTIGGRTQSLTQWAREVGISDQGLAARLHRGMTPEQAISTPLFGKGH